MRRTRFSKVLALTLVFVMVMSSVASAAAPGIKISNTLNATFNVAPVNTVANVVDLPTLKTALANPVIQTIDFAANFETVAITETLVVDRALTINGNNKSLEFTAALNLLEGGKRQGILIKADNVTINGLGVVMNGALAGSEADKDGWQGVYGIQAYEANKVTLNNVTASGADGGILVNGSEVKLTGTTTVSDNEFGGIEVSKGTGVTSNSLLTVDSILVNGTEKYAVPTIWLVTGQGSVVGTGVPAYTNDTIKTDQVQYYIIDQVAKAMNAVNDATDVKSVRVAFQTYSLALGIDSAIMTKFNEMPEDQGRQQAVAAAVMMFDYTTTAEIKTVFEGSVNKEHAKMEFVNAVDRASSAADMKLALDAPLKLINTNRVKLIAQLKAVNYDVAVINALEASTYTRVLAQVSIMPEADLTSLAQALYAKRIAVGGNFFGVVQITDAIDEILNTINPEDYITLRSDTVLTNLIAATAGQTKEVKVFAKVNNPTLVTKPELKVVVKLNDAVVNNVVVVNGTINKDIDTEQELTITFTFPSEGSYNVEIYVVEGPIA